MIRCLATTLRRDMLLKPSEWRTAMRLTRRMFLLTTCLTVCHGPQVAAQGVFSEASRISDSLKNADNLTEVATLAMEWNRIFRTTAGQANPEYVSDLDLYLDAVQGEIESAIQGPALNALLASLAPKMYALLQRIPAWVSPMMAFLSALQPSNIASDIVEIHHLNTTMQDRIRAAFDRVSGEPLWFSTLQDGILPLPQPERPTLRLP